MKKIKGDFCFSRLYRQAFRYKIVILIRLVLMKDLELAHNIFFNIDG